ncbi:MAG: hypothetical protein A6D92_12635 [Symbiobacterium thermophilum]|uniref:HTH gntR-type domain-containing protein n=1 Tax=Symbiobacterium thermophilum TaxID=2734 RepID=A0A1Y2T5A4_SYMTR|nr:MAG: hypothetical protein A6D92_12635 [Symbiobacterium thermophilum]
MIQRNVEEGRWPVGHRIPSERELCQQHGVSRTTVRLAIAEAVSRGLLHRVHGKGTFVARPRSTSRWSRSRPSPRPCGPRGSSPGPGCWR